MALIWPSRTLWTAFCSTWISVRWVCLSMSFRRSQLYLSMPPQGEKPGRPLSQRGTSNWPYPLRPNFEGASLALMQQLWNQPNSMLNGERQAGQRHCSPVCRSIFKVENSILPEQKNCKQCWSQVPLENLLHIMSHLCVEFFWNSMQASLHSKGGCGPFIYFQQMLHLLGN